MNDGSRREYVARINRVIDYIEGHLGEPLSLETLARVACFSPFHFHRVFGVMVGEPLGQFVGRVRVERAATLLVSHPNRSITEIGLDCGYSSSAAFSRAFRDAFGMTATQWRNGGSEEWHKKDGEVQRRSWQRVGSQSQDYDVLSYSFNSESGRPRWRLRVKDLDPVWLEVRDVPELHVAYVRHIGPYQGMAEVFAELFGKLTNWAAPRGLLAAPDARLIAVYHDNPEVTDDGKLRVSAGLTVPRSTEVGGEIGAMTMEGGQTAVARFELGDEDYARAWYAVAGCWLPQSGYQPDDRYCYELYHDCGDAVSTVDICVPVRPL
jgi:AraC family transcriptional regulator